MRVGEVKCEIKKTKFFRILHCSILQFGENREEVMTGRRSRKRKLRPTGGQAISTSPCLGRWLQGSGMALKVPLFFIGDLN